jgi:hypothetical protein
MVEPARRVLLQAALCRADGLAVSISGHDTQHGVSIAHAELFGVFVDTSPRIVPGVERNYLPNGRS